MTAEPQNNLLLHAICRMNAEIDAELAVVPEAPSPDQLLDTAHLATLLMISPRTLEGWRSDGRGPAVTKIGGNVRHRYRDCGSR